MQHGVESILTYRTSIHADRSGYFMNFISEGSQGLTLSVLVLWAHASKLLSEHQTTIFMSVYILIVITITLSRYSVEFSRLSWNTHVWNGSKTRMVNYNIHFRKNFMIQKVLLKKRKVIIKSLKNHSMKHFWFARFDLWDMYIRQSFNNECIGIRHQSQIAVNVGVICRRIINRS